MSLLEDVFLNDEANEALELERVIEGDEYDDEHPPLLPDSNENSEKEDEAEEERTRVDPTKAKTRRVVKNPRFVLNPARLTGPRGIQIIPDHFKDFKFRGKGHEKEDLDLVLKKLEHWAYRLYPRYEFVDCLKKIETLGKKRSVMVHLAKIRSDQLVSEEVVVQKDSDEEVPQPEEDEFDKLLQRQIELARATPRDHSAAPMDRTPLAAKVALAPKVISSPSISDEQRERMLRNKRMAEERRLSRLKQTVTSPEEPVDENSLTIDSSDAGNGGRNDGVEQLVDDVPRKQRRQNVIDSSSDDDDVSVIRESVSVDIHGSSAMRAEEVVEDGHNVNTGKDEIDATDIESNNDILFDSLIEDYGNKDVGEENVCEEIVNLEDVGSVGKSNGEGESDKNDKSKENNESSGNSENVPPNTELDIMDVDFDDDF